MDYGHFQAWVDMVPLKIWGVLAAASVLSHKGGGDHLATIISSPAGSAAPPSAILPVLPTVPAAEDGTWRVCQPRRPWVVTVSLSDTFPGLLLLPLKSSFCSGLLHPQLPPQAHFSPQPPGGSNPGPQLLSSATLPAGPPLSSARCSLAAQGGVLSLSCIQHWPPRDALEGVCSVKERVRFTHSLQSLAFVMAISRLGWKWCLETAGSHWRPWQRDPVKPLPSLGLSSSAARGMAALLSWPG